MKKIESVMVTGSTGQIPADTYDRWTKTIEGAEFEFALHADPTPGKGFLRKLRVCEVSTGFDTGTVILHPVTRVHMTEAALTSLSARQIKQTSRAALHGHLNRVGYINFVRAVVDAQITKAKQGTLVSVEPAVIQSANFDKEKGTGWQLRKDGAFDASIGAEGLGKLIGVGQ